MRRFLGFLALALTFAMAMGCATNGGKAKASAPTGQPDKGIAARLTGKTWLLAGYAPDKAFFPLEPEHGTTAMLILKPDGSLGGSTGWNEFSGSWAARREGPKGECPVTFRIAKSSKEQAPNDIAERFDRDLQRLLVKSVKLKEAKDSFVLLDAAGKIILRFIFRKDGAF